MDLAFPRGRQDRKVRPLLVLLEVAGYGVDDVFRFSFFLLEYVFYVFVELLAHSFCKRDYVRHSRAVGRVKVPELLKGETLGLELLELVQATMDRTLGRAR